MAEKKRVKKSHAIGMTDGGDISGGVSPSFVASDPLQNEQHELFCQELLLLKPQQRAYQKAYPGVSLNVASAASSRLLDDVRVRERLAYLKKEQRERYKMTADDIHARLVMAAFVDPADMFDADGNPIPIHKLPPEVRLSIESFEVEDIVVGEGDNKVNIGRTSKIKVISKAKSLELLGRHQSMFNDNLKVTGTLTLEQLVAGEVDDGSET